MKAAIIETNKMITPDTQTVGIFFGELKNNPRLIWINNRIKNNEAPLRCINRNTQPDWISRIMWIIELKASSVDLM